MYLKRPNDLQFVMDGVVVKQTWTVLLKKIIIIMAKFGNILIKALNKSLKVDKNKLLNPGTLHARFH